MEFNKYNLAKMLKSEWFIEVGEPCMEEDYLIHMPNITMDNKIADTLYEPNSFYGFSSMELYKEDDGYYIKSLWQEPIGDYDTEWWVRWYKSINNEAISSVLNRI